MRSEADETTELQDISVNSEVPSLTLNTAKMANKCCQCFLMCGTMFLDIAAFAIGKSRSYEQFKPGFY